MRVETGPGHIKIARAGAVLSITLDRPEKKNALSGPMYLAATEALQDVGSDPSIGAILFAGAGGVFTAGNDLADFLDADSWEGEFPAFTFIKAVASCETALVAAIDGVGVGIGATMMLHCDLVYVAPETLFRLPFVDLGVVPEAACSLLLPRRIGMAKASEFLLLGESFGPQEAVRLGLANRILPQSELHAYAAAQAQKLAEKPRAALAATRRLLRGERSAILARIEEESRLFAAALRSEEARAAITSFLEKRR
jgi:enoyl-CoA hydratase/carnithine racemase